MRHVLASLTLVLAVSAPAADYQFMAALPTKNQHTARAFLWIPPTCATVRGIIYGRQVILEKLVLDDPIIRNAAQDNDLAIVLTKDTDSTYTYSKDATGPADIQALLDQLAASSGYPEIVSAPWLPIGHSGAAIGAWNMGYAKPERTFGIVGLHATGINRPDYDTKAKVTGIPILCINGEWEMWTGPERHLNHHVNWLRGVLLGMRGVQPEVLATALIQPGAGHFNWDARLAHHVADFIHAAADLRLPPKSSPTPAPLRNVPLESGWLSQATRAEVSQFPPAPFAAYTGDPFLAYWHPTGDLAKRTDAYAAMNVGRKPQMLSFVENGKVLPASWNVGIKPTFEADGETIRVQAAFLDRWPEKTLGAGMPLGHAATGTIHYQLIGGWNGGGEQTGPDTFKVRPSCFGGPGGGLMLIASHDGDGQYGYTEMAGTLNVPDRFKEGTAQTIDFPQPADVPAGAKDVTLSASATSGLEVSYTVIAGPAEVVGNRLTFTALPPKSPRPVTILVQAWQRGRPIEPLVKTAEPVVRSFTWGGP